MYDENVKTINLTSDEMELLKELLFYRLDRCISVGEEIVVKELMDKLR